MPKSVIQYDLLISCPGDIKDEVDCIKEVVDQFNATFADSLGISIRTKHWSKNSYPQSGGKPQTLLNKQFVNDCDAAVAIMWTRFGTPTDEYGSGTEEEIEILLHDGKQVFMYFCDKPLNPSQMDSEEYKRVKAFKDKYKGRGIYSSYTSIDDFKRDFFAHLSQYFLSLNTIENLKKERHSSLLIEGLTQDNHISENAVICDFKLRSEYDKDGFTKKIKEYYTTINSIKTVKTIKNPGNPLLTDTFSFLLAATIDQNEKDIITEVAKLFKIEISDDFFDLGNLHQSIGALPGYSSVSGTDEEKRKYYLINDLFIAIQDFSKWSSADSALSGLKHIELLLTNNGTDVDEDVEVTLSFPKDSLITVDTFPELSNEDKKYLMNEKGLNEVFHTYPTADYLDYNESIIRHKPIATQIDTVPNIFGTNTSQKFKDSLYDIFGYDVYLAEDKYIVKIKFDYIKHNTSVAFPSMILLRHDINGIPFTITSKHCPEKITGVLSVKK